MSQRDREKICNYNFSHIHALRKGRPKGKKKIYIKFNLAEVCVFSFLKQAARIPFFFCLWLVDGLSEENHYGLPH